MWKIGFKGLQASRGSAQSEFIRYRGEAATVFRTGDSNPGQAEPETAQGHCRLQGNRCFWPIQPAHLAQLLGSLPPTGITNQHARNLRQIAEMRLIRERPWMQVMKACDRFSPSLVMQREEANPSLWPFPYLWQWRGRGDGCISVPQSTGKAKITYFFN